MLASDTLLKERYRVVHKIGGGGFGYVYKAIDEVFGCSVAIKETREEVSNLDKLRKAFEREAKLLRNLKHDSLPRVTDYFIQDHAQFLVMDFIEGEDLACLLKKHLQEHREPFTCRDILPWADKILDALEYLHSRPEPIIHRDIKPSNIKLADDGGIYLLDFGLAKGATGQMSTIVEGQTSSSVLGYTREYAPLEQLQGTETERQSDIYALGATLYHLLTGHFPVAATQRDEALQRGKGDPLRPAHEINPAIPLAVSNTISRALAVRWWDRINSAAEMRVALKLACEKAEQPVSLSAPVNLKDEASTLRLTQQHEAVPSKETRETTPPKTLAPLRRRPWLIAAGVGLVSILSLAVVVRLAFPHWFAPEVPKRPGPQAVQPTESLKPPQPVTTTDLKPEQTLNGHEGFVWSVAFSPDGSIAASGGDDHNIILWDTRTWKPTLTLTGHTDAVYTIAFSPDGKTLASGSRDATIRLWDTQTGRLIESPLHEDDNPVLRLAFSPDGNLLASCSGQQKKDGAIRLWYAHNGWKSKTLEGHEDAVIAIAFSPDSSTLFSSSYDKSLRLWNLTRDGQSEVLRRYDQPLIALALSPDGKYLACGSGDATIKLWLSPSQMQERQELQPLKAYKSLEPRKRFITSIAFSPDNKTLVSASKDAAIRLWDVAAGTSKLLASKSEIQTPQRSVAFSPDGQMLMTGGEDGVIRVWK